MPYFTNDELRATDTALANTTKYPDARLDEIRALVEEALEDETMVAFVPRAATETLSARSGEDVLITRWPRVRSVTAVTIDGVAFDAAALAELRVTPIGIWRPRPWPPGQSHITVTYMHGYDVPPLRVKRAALTLAKNWLLNGPIDDRATQISAGDGGVINLATPGIRGSAFGIPEVDAVVARYGERIPAIG